MKINHPLFAEVAEAPPAGAAAASKSGMIPESQAPKPSAMRDAMIAASKKAAQAQDDSAAPPAKVEAKTPPEKAPEGQKEPPVKAPEKADPAKERQSTDDDELFNTDNIPANNNIKEKFKRFKDEIKTNRTRLEELQKTVAEKEEALTRAKAEAEAASKKTTDIKETDEFKELAKRLADAEERGERLDLESSPKFSAKFDGPMSESADNIATIIEGAFDDQSDMADLGKKIQAALSVPTGRKTEGAFLRTLNAAFDDVDIPQTMRSRIENEAMKWREIATKRHDALVQWRDTKKSQEEQSHTERDGVFKETSSHFDAVTAEYEQEHKTLLEAIRKVPGLNYDETVNANLVEARNELSITVKTGKPTEGLLSMLNMSARAGTAAKMVELTSNAYKDLQSKYEELLGQVRSKSGSSPTSGGTGSKKEAPSDDDGEEKGGAMVAAMKRVAARTN